MLVNSAVINGQLVSVAPGLAINPNTIGPLYQGGQSPVPTVPPGAMGSGSGASGDLAVAAKAGANPWSPTESPLPWVVGALIVGLLGLRYIHWEF